MAVQGGSQAGPPAGFVQSLCELGGTGRTSALRNWECLGQPSRLSA